MIVKNSRSSGLMVVRKRRLEWPHGREKGHAFREWPPGALAPLWSIAVEEQFYVLAPFMYRLLRSRYALVFCIAVFAISNVGRIAYIALDSLPSGNGGLYYVTHAYADTFLAGAVVAHWYVGRGKCSAITQRIAFALGAR